MIEINDLKNLCINASRNLIEMLDENEWIKDVRELPNLQTKMIFPTYKRELEEDTNKKSEEKPVRISEQEARFQFCLAIERYYKEIYYSIETPTKYNYSFSGKDDNNKKIKKLQIFIPDAGNDKVGMSARFDMSLFEKIDSKLEQVCDIEFKMQSPDKDKIEKDLLKLFAESKLGLFFHFLYSNDSNALNNDFKKFDESISCIIQHFDEINCKNCISIKNDFIREKIILFAFFILKDNLIIFKEYNTLKNSNIKDFFVTKYKHSDKDFSNLVGWDVIKIK